MFCFVILRAAGALSLCGSDGTGMLTKQGVKEALSQMGMDSSEDAVDQVTSLHTPLTW
jgi:hypothetical protein